MKNQTNNNKKIFPRLNEYTEIKEINKNEKRNTYFLYYKERDEYILEEVNTHAKTLSDQSTYLYISKEPLVKISDNIFYGKLTGRGNYLTNTYSLIINWNDERPIENHKVNLTVTANKMNVSKLEIIPIDDNRYDIKYTIDNISDNYHTFLKITEQEEKQYQFYYSEKDDQFYPLNASKLNKKNLLSFVDAIISSTHYQSLITTHEETNDEKQLKEKIKKIYNKKNRI